MGALSIGRRSVARRRQLSAALVDHEAGHLSVRLLEHDFCIDADRGEFPLAGRAQRNRLLPAELQGEHGVIAHGNDDRRERGSVVARIGIEHVARHLDSPLPLEELAALAGLSVFQLDQRIRGLFGVTAGQYVLRARIERACDLLRHSRDPISEIALACGYADQASFTRQFRKSVGLTPSAYRAMK